MKTHTSLPLSLRLVNQEDIDKAIMAREITRKTHAEIYMMGVNLALDESNSEDKE